MRTLMAPGVEWREIDRSQYSPSMTGTACFIPVFTNKGEPYKYMEFTSRSAWTNYYGEPDNEAERYGYAAICEVLNQGGRCYTARLPYDNMAFEKMVGVKYSVADQIDVSTDYQEVVNVDSELNKAALIKGGYEPCTFSLDEVDEFRSHEKTVPANTFYIVDTTGATYKKVPEDSRKGQDREVVGIVPVVTTAANAMLAQQLITTSLNRISCYETIGGTYFNTLNYTCDDGTVLSNEGLLTSDCAQLINTQGQFGLQTNTFTCVPIRRVETELTGTVSTLGELRSDILKYIERYKLSDKYNANTLHNIAVFHNDLKDKKVTEITEQTEVDELVNKCYALIGATISAWYYVDVSTGEVTTVKFADNIDEYMAQFKLHSTAPIFCTDSYIDPSQVKYAKDESGNTYAYANAYEASPLSPAEWHTVNGDNNVPYTMSQNANEFFATIQPASDGVGLDPEHLKDIGVVVYKMYLDPTEGNKVSYEAVEAYCGSLYKDDVDPNTGVTKFIDTIINSQSQYINFFSNCFSTPSRKKWYKETCDILIAEPCTPVSLGFFEKMTVEDISISKSILDGLNKAFDKITDLNLLDIDIVCDAGIANIASYLKAIFGDKGQYDLNITDDVGNSLLGLWTCKKATDPSVKTWKTVEQKYDNFCKNVRKDCMFIADGMRPLVLQGQKKIIRDTKPKNTIDANILPYFPAICGLNTNFGAGYVDWFETADDYTGDFFWCPPSIKAMGVYINTDVNYNYWDAPAGLNRGMIAATDVAFSPTPKQAGCFYEKNWNYAINYPADGIVLEGQKTFQVKPSAFDRVNVRRLFLRLERQCYKVARYFVYEGNTAYLRQRLVDAVDPYFKSAKAGGGVYDYKIVCDESNNTANTIDNNELHISIGIKPTKTAEFIIFTFIAGSTGASWEEIMG